MMKKEQEMSVSVLGHERHSSVKCVFQGMKVLDLTRKSIGIGHELSLLAVRSSESFAEA